LCLWIKQFPGHWVRKIENACWPRHRGRRFATFRSRRSTT